MSAQNVDQWEYLASVVRRRRSSFLTAEEYDEAIRDLQNAKTQLRPDGNNCAVCHDSGHQAWECHHNPLVMARRGVKAEMEWRCFHCGFVCHTAEAAVEHFGKSEDEVARCLRPGEQTASSIGSPITLGGQ
ncbi:hypothetical protein R70006_06256 [Paraburkholderia domus]|uniref:hypothetical protein n=1 Tax=Paraburkholderia domus TaxID=2793075 RepID=UPI001913A798|nr:hypothetical protein [Paraburkholderia domus]MBK5052888.1 hypothetical protein [Burkholderia sp. R-70006]CAE6822220.1 hypothetical protein R70006_06256 [Paraburkholderia domus]